MATYNLSFNTTPEQEIGLDHVFARANAERVTAGQEPFATKDAFALDLIMKVLEDYGRQFKQSLKDQVGAALDEASPQQIQAAMQALGVTPA